SHSFTVPSRLPEASLFPSGEKITEETLSSCSPRASSSCPLAISHSFTVRSSLPEASFFPSGEKATEETIFECPLSVKYSCAMVASHSFTVLSQPVARRNRYCVNGSLWQSCHR